MTDREFSFLSAIPPEPGNLVQGLQTIQNLCGCISDEAIDAAAAYFSRSAADVEGIVSFYRQFKRVKPGRFRITVCDGSACRQKGAPEIVTWISRELGIAPGETTANGLFSLETVSCLGRCAIAPVMSVNDRIYGKLEPQAVAKILQEYAEKSSPSLSPAKQAFSGKTNGRKTRRSTT